MWPLPKPVPPEEMTGVHRCPGCNEPLALDWVWASDFIPDIYSDVDDYIVWFFECDNCAENYDLINGELHVCE